MKISTVWMGFEIDRGYNAELKISGAYFGFFLFFTYMIHCFFFPQRTEIYLSQNHNFKNLKVSYSLEFLDPKVPGFLKVNLYLDLNFRVN